jgi:hypothetical protein
LRTYSLTLESEYHTFWVVQYLPTLKLEIFIGKLFTDVRVKNIIGRIKKKEKMFFSNFRQNHQYSLPHVGHLKGDSIFPFA